MLTYSAWANLALNLLWAIYSILITCLRCIPLAKYWDLTQPGHCLNEVTFLLSVTIWGLICDIITWTLPVPMIWNLNARRSYKIGLTALMSLGLIAVAVGGVRVWAIITIDATDYTWTVAIPSNITFVEAGTGIICACGPTVAPVCRKLFSGGAYVWDSVTRLFPSRYRVNSDDDSIPDISGKRPPRPKVRSQWSPVKLPATASVQSPMENFEDKSSELAVVRGLEDGSTDEVDRAFRG